MPGASIYLNFCYEIFLLVTRSSQKNARCNGKCSRHPRKCNFYLRFVESFEFALVCAFLRRFALVLHFLCTCVRPFWRQLDHGEEENTAELDFCPNRQKALGSEWEAKSATSSQFWYRTRGEAEIYATMEVPGGYDFVLLRVPLTSLVAKPSHKRQDVVRVPSSQTSRGLFAKQSRTLTGTYPIR